ncbi:MAG: hypothetical protein JXR97_08680 [Planctomycetes bacterium]|nr:hypothetical protein [Planctomycetota bacterium]
MQLVVDLHSHSGHAGGVGDVSPALVTKTMAQKGIDVFGTGDCLQPEWLDTLESTLKEEESGFFSFTGEGGDANGSERFCLQSEIIITADVPSGGRKGPHVVLLFPSFSAAREVAKILAAKETKLNMGRPFVKCKDADDVAATLDKVQAVDESILIMPAHVLTPQGIFGSDHPIDSMRDFFDDFASRIRAVETGLSADPEILALIPELDNVTLLSNSDCHSAALNRVGREFTALEVSDKSYGAMIQAIHDRKVNFTAEFTPTEGRFFLTGHRAGKVGHENGEYCYFSPDKAPADNVCPICGKQMTIGVIQRALELGRLQGDERSLESITPRQKALHMVPLVEVLAAGLGVKSISSRKIVKMFDEITKIAGTEVQLWGLDEKEITSKLGNALPREVLDAILMVKQGNFCFNPLGYDGTYGDLVLGQQGVWFGHEKIFMG